MGIKDNNTNYLKNALVLAYLGDSVFTLMVRDYLVNHSNIKAGGLNKIANSIVKAPNQAEIMKAIKETLTEEENDIVMRARNSHINNKAKNSSFEEYSLATQFEAIVGYWYLNKEQDKLNNMFNTYVVNKLEK